MEGLKAAATSALTRGDQSVFPQAINHRPSTHPLKVKRPRLIPNVGSLTESFPILMTLFGSLSTEFPSS